MSGIITQCVICRATKKMIVEAMISYKVQAHTNAHEQPNSLNLFT